jgi:hypothetical protein
VGKLTGLPNFMSPPRGSSAWIAAWGLQHYIPTSRSASVTASVPASMLYKDEFQ